LFPGHTRSVRLTAMAKMLLGDARRTVAFEEAAVIAWRRRGWPPSQDISGLLKKLAANN